MQRSETGFSLIEVIASLVLVSIVLLSFAQIFIQSNKTAVDNTEKVVVINLADAQLERLKMDYSKLVGIESLTSEKDFTLDPIKINNKLYSVIVTATPTPTEKERKLVNIIVTVTAPNNKTKSSIEGYIKL